MLRLLVKRLPRDVCPFPFETHTKEPTNIFLAFQLVTGRVWKGCAFGGVKGRTQLPGLVSDYLNGDLKVDEFITHRQPLDKINQAFGDMKAGDCIRCVVNMRET